MLVASDATAADLIVERVGLKKVEKAMKASAPDSTLPMDTEDMVKAFRQIPGSQSLKTQNWTVASVNLLLDQCSNFGKTTSKDLANLALGTLRFQPKAELSVDFEQLIRTEQAGDTKRSRSFLAPPVCCFGKGGSLGYRFISNDCGVFYLSLIHI